MAPIEPEIGESLDECVRWLIEPNLGVPLGSKQYLQTWQCQHLDVRRIQPHTARGLHVPQNRFVKCDGSGQIEHLRQFHGVPSIHL